MATGGILPAEDDELRALAEEYGTCAICLDLAKDHRALACQHVFCLTCIGPLVQNSHIKCPSCQEVMTLSGNIEQLPKNLFLNGIIAKFCETCMNKRRVVYCRHCSLWLCESCHKSCRDTIDSEVKCLCSRSEAVLSRQHKFAIDIERAKAGNQSNIATLSNEIREHSDKLVAKLREEEQNLLEHLRSECRANEQKLENLLVFGKVLTSQISQKMKVTSDFTKDLDQYNDLNKTSKEWHQMMKYESWKGHRGVNNITFVPNKEMLTDVQPSLLGKLDIDTPSTPAPPLVDFICGEPNRIVIGHQGTAPGEFNSPSCVAISPLSGNMFVTDSDNDRIQVFDSTGQFMRTFGQNGHERGDFLLDDRSGITVTEDGQVIICDTCNRRVKIYSEQGDVIRILRGGADLFKFLSGVTSNGHFMYVCDSDAYQIHIMRLDGKLINTISTAPVKPWSVARRSNGEILVACGNNPGELRVFSPEGFFLDMICIGDTGSIRLEKPFGVAIQNTGEIVVSDFEGNQVHVLGSDKSLIRTLGSPGTDPGQFDRPVGVTSTNDGRIVVVDQGNDRLQIFSNWRYDKVTGEQAPA